MEENAFSEEMFKHQEIFPWLKTFLKKLMNSFPDDCIEDVLQYLVENLKREVNATSKKCSLKWLKALFETTEDLFLHFWWRIRWKGKKMWKKYWRKGNLETFSRDIRTRCVGKLLYFLIHIGIILSEGDSNSIWLIHVIQAIKLFPVHDDIILTSLLMVKTLKKKYHRCYCIILKQVLMIKSAKCISQPFLYIKIIMLFRRLNFCLEDANEKRTLQAVVSKFQAPPNLMPWMSSLDLDISKLNHKNISQDLFKKSSSNLFKKLKVILADYEFLPSKEKSKNNNVENVNSQEDMDLTAKVFHSFDDSKVVETESLCSENKTKKPKKRRKNKTNNSSEIAATGATEDHLYVLDNESSSQNVTLGSAPASPTAAHGTSLDLDDTNNKVMEDSSKDNSVENLNSQDDVDLTLKVDDSKIVETRSCSESTDKRKQKRRKMKTNGKRKIDATANLNKDYLYVLDKEDSENATLGLILPSNATINGTLLDLDDTNTFELKNKTCHHNINISPQLSPSTLQDLVFNPTSQLNVEDCQIPLSSEINKTITDNQITVDKIEKKNTFNINKNLILCKRGKISKTGMKKFKLFDNDSFQNSRKLVEVQTNNKVMEDSSKDNSVENLNSQDDMDLTLNVDDSKIVETKSCSESTDKRKRKRRKMKTNDKHEINATANLNQDHLSVLDNEDSGNATLCPTPPSNATINGTSLDEDDTNSFELKNKTCHHNVNISPRLSPSTVQGLFFNSAPQLNVEDCQVPLSSEINKTITYNQIAVDKIEKKNTFNFSKKLSLCKSSKTGMKKFKLFNNDTFKGFKDLVEVHDNNEVVFNVNDTAEISLLNNFTNVNSAHDVNKWHDLSTSLIETTSCNEVSSKIPSVSKVFENSCRKVAENVVVEKQVCDDDDDVMQYNTQSPPLFDSPYSTDVDDSFQEGTCINKRNMEYSENSVEALIRKKDVSVPEEIFGMNQNAVSTVYKAADHMIDSYENQPSINLVQKVNAINLCSKITNDHNMEHCSYDHAIPREAHFYSDSTPNLEQQCNTFNSMTTFENSNSNSADHNVVDRNKFVENRPNTAAENDVLFRNQTMNETVNMGKNAIKVHALPQKDSVLNHSNTATRERNSFVIECSMPSSNDLYHSSSESRSKNPDIPHVTVVIHLNNSRNSDIMLLQNERCVGKHELSTRSLNSNASVSTSTDDLNLPPSLPSVNTTQALPQYKECSLPSHDISISSEKTPMQHKNRQGLFSSTPQKRSCQSSPAKVTFNKTPKKTGCFLTPSKLILNDSCSTLPADGPEFHTPQTLDCESGVLSGNSQFPSGITSLQKRYIDETAQAVLNSSDIDSIAGVFPLQSQQSQSSSENDFRQSKTVYNFTSKRKKSSSNETFRNSATDIYSDVSCDDISVSTMDGISDEETDHSLINAMEDHSSSEIPVKRRNFGTENRSRMRVVSDSSFEHDSGIKTISDSTVKHHSRTRSISDSSVEQDLNTDDNHHQNKKMSFSNLNHKANPFKKPMNPKSIIKPTIVRRKYNKSGVKKMNPIQSSYNLRPRNSILQPEALNEYTVQKF